MPGTVCAWDSVCLGQCVPRTVCAWGQFVPGGSEYLVQCVPGAVIGEYWTGRY